MLSAQCAVLSCDVDCKFAVLCALQQCWAVICDVLKYVLYIRYSWIPDVQYRVLRDVLLSFSSYFELCYNVLCCTVCRAGLIISISTCCLLVLRGAIPYFFVLYLGVTAGIEPTT